MLFDYDVILGFTALLLLSIKRRAIREWGLMLGISFLFMQGVARAAYIPSGSMEPTVAVNDRIFVDVLSARVVGPERDEVVLLRSPEDGKMLCKRIVGVAGDVLEVRDNHLYRNGRIADDRPTDGSYGPYTVPADSFFVMGDQRNNSHDSRAYGPVPTYLLAGRARAIFWPPAHAAPLDK